MMNPFRSLHTYLHIHEPVNIRKSKECTSHAVNHTFKSDPPCCIGTVKEILNVNNITFITCIEISSKIMARAPYMANFTPFEAPLHFLVLGLRLSSLR